MDWQILSANRKLSDLVRILSVAYSIPEVKLDACFHAEIKRKCVGVISSREDAELAARSLNEAKPPVYSAALELLGDATVFTLFLEWSLV